MKAVPCLYAAGEATGLYYQISGGVVVDNDVEHFASGHLGLHGIEEADELLMAVALLDR